MKNAPLKNAPFFSEGLKFSCVRCSSCCRYESGFVFLSEKDLNRLILELGMTRESFIGAYCRWVDSDCNGEKSLSLKEKLNKDCILWDNGCKIYNSRPDQCRSFPFWERIVASSQAWEMAASGCPGMNSGELYTKDAIYGIIAADKKEKVIKKGET